MRTCLKSLVNAWHSQGGGGWRAPPDNAASAGLDFLPSSKHLVPSTLLPHRFTKTLNFASTRPAVPHPLLVAIKKSTRTSLYRSRIPRLSRPSVVVSNREFYAPAPPNHSALAITQPLASKSTCPFDSNATVAAHSSFTKAQHATSCYFTRRAHPRP